MINRKNCYFDKKKNAKMDVKVRTKYIGRKWLGRLLLQISYFPIDLFVEQYKLAMAAINSSINTSLWPCTDSFWQ